MGATRGALRPDVTWAQMGTIGVEAIERLARKLHDADRMLCFRRAGVRQPRTGSPRPASHPRSGPDRSHDAVDAVFEALRHSAHSGLGPAGTASRLKLVLNAWLAFEIEAAAEAGAPSLASPGYKDLADARDRRSAGLAPLIDQLPDGRGDYSADFALEWAVEGPRLALARHRADTRSVRSIAERLARLVCAGTDISTSATARLGLNAWQARETRDLRV